MKKIVLGNTGIKVSEYCLGALPMGPVQANIAKEECINIIRTAVKYGVNFIDTAETYQTQSYIGLAVKENRKDVIISTKSWADSYDGMAISLEKSLNELDTDYIDLYHLHAGRASTNIFVKRSGAFKFLQKMKKEKVIRAIGVATHHVDVVDKAAELDEVDVIFALINKTGLGILGGTKEDMIEKIKKAYRSGKGVYAMKALAGGNLINDIKNSFSWVRNISEVSSVAVGIVSVEELLYNLQLFGVKDLVDHKFAPERKMKKLRIVKKVCIGCGSCVDACQNDAIVLINDQAEVLHEQCILCGYCTPKCPQFAIRIS